MNDISKNAELACAVVGAGWRTEFFMRIAHACEAIRVVGVVARDLQRRQAFQAEWGVPCFDSIDSLLAATSPSYVIASVSQAAMPEVCIELARRGVPILAETPPAPDLERLVTLYETLTGLDARIQIAEQFWAQPLHAARQAVVNSGRLGAVSQAYLSVCHGYHAMSLLRRLLGTGFANAEIRGQRFASRVIAGPDRFGPPREERLVDVDNDTAWLDFGDRLAQYDFCQPQYWSWIRGQRVCIRGERGEIVDDSVTFLEDPVTPITARLVRHEAGRHGNHEGFHLKGLQFLDRWVYRNPVAPVRLNDEEIAIAHCMLAMQRYVDTGVSFYSLAEACQDQYLALAVADAVASGEAIRTTSQVWSGQA